MQKLFLCILFVFLGFGPKIYIPLGIIYLLFVFKNYLILKYKKTFLIFLIFNVMFILTLFLIGSDYMTLVHPYYNMIKLLFAVLLIAFVSYKEKNNILTLIVCYTFGLFAISIIVIGYSFFENPLQYGYGKLLNPFRMEEENSPAYSNNLTLVFIVFLYYFFTTKNIFSKLMSIFIIMISLWGAFFLAGRTFFFLSGLFLLLFFITFASKKNMLIYVALIISISFIIVSFDNYFENYLAFSLQRLSEGLQSNRWLLWKDALSKILTNPFGGFTVNPMIEDTFWYHNLWLDTARTSGWIPLIALLTSNLFILYLSIKALKKGKESFMLLLMLIISLMVMAQDVIIEGNWRILMFYYIIISALLGGTNTEKLK